MVSVSTRKPWHPRRVEGETSLVAVVYHRRYNIGFLGMERLHPFDSRKYGRSWRELTRLFGHELKLHHISVDRSVSNEELLLAHSQEYLSRMKQSENIVEALEIPSLRRAPAWLLRWSVLRPMRWAVRGTVLAARAALNCGTAINLSGGYHHAKRDVGEGFCVFSDIAVAIRQLRAEGMIASGQRVAYVDLDAHQGNGICHQFQNDRDVFIFDMYNSAIYPYYDLKARQRIDCNIPLSAGCRGQEYLGLLRKHLPGFLDSVSRSAAVALGIFNAGTDVVQGDPLGAMALTPDEVLERDLITFEEFRKRRIPIVMLTSGGYTRESYRLITSTVSQMLQQCGAAMATNA